MKREIINYVFRNLKRRKGRTFLTALSIFIGITTIFIFVSFGGGLYFYVKELSSSSSIDKVVIQPKGAGFLPNLNSNFKLTEKEIRIIEKIPGVIKVSGIVFAPVEVSLDKEKSYTYLIAYNPSEPLILEVFNIKIERGRELKKEDKNKIVMGYNYLLEKKIFTKKLDVNQKIKIQNKEFTIIGFFESVGSPQDDAQVYINIEDIKEIFPEKKEKYDWVVAKVDLNQIDETVKKIEEELRKERKEKKGEESFSVQTFEDLIASYSSALNIIILFVIAIALVSVLVSAVNTSNTMITSVLERYKEIGIMKSIGAKNSDILSIFLIESSLIGFFGGVVGVFLGYILSSIGGNILFSLGYGFLKPFYHPFLFIGCILFAIITGAISGMVPAIKASKINPVDSLRYE
ncbi:MAG: FtsX-like permease family protein [Candidatus Pacearchaeota archaeon]